MTYDIGAFSKDKAEKIKIILDGKTYMNFKVLVYPLDGEWHVLITTDYDINKEEFIEFLVFFLASQLD